MVCKKRASMNEPHSAVSSIHTTIAIVLIVSLGIVIPVRVSADTFYDVSTDYWLYNFEGGDNRLLSVRCKLHEYSFAYKYPKTRTHLRVDNLDGSNAI